MIHALRSASFRLLLAAVVACAAAGPLRAEPDAERQRPSPANRSNPSQQGERPDPRDRIDRAVSVLKDIHPELAERLNHALEHRPRRARGLLGRRMPMLLRLAELRERDPEMYGLRVRDLQLAREALRLMVRHRALDAAPRDAGPAASEALRAELRGVLAERFEVRTRIRERELERLERRLEALEAELAERSASREMLIDQRLETMLHGELDPGELLQPPHVGDRGNGDGGRANGGHHGEGGGDSSDGR